MKKTEENDRTKKTQHENQNNESLSREEERWKNTRRKRQC